MKYKLIKCYPGYNELGIIHSSENKNLEWKGTYYYDKYPEFWEKIVEKDYEIISFILNNKLFTLDRTQNKYFSKDRNFAQYIDSLNDTIHSVKRTSDGVVFTIGDKINRACYKNIDIIRGFNLLDDLCLASISDEVDNGYISSKGVNIAAIEHVKEVLFTTEDGVDIYVGDETWILYKNSFFKNGCI